MKLNTIIEAVCEDYDISPGMIQSQRRFRAIVGPRQVIHFFAKQMTPLSLDAIGELVGNKNHCAVIHSKKVVNELMETDKKYKERIKRIEDKLVKIAFNDATFQYYDMDTYENRKLIIL